jgi:hypothetical protein
MSNDSAVAPAQTDEIDDVAGDVANALNELRGGEAPTETQITLDKSDRPRDEAGRFAQMLKDDKAERAGKRETLTLPDKPKPEGVQADPTQQLGVAPPEQIAPVAPPTPATPSVSPPGALKSEFKAKFGELPPEWQQEFSRCESEAQKALRNQDEDRMFGRRINQLVSPYLPTIRAEGATPEKAFENYLQTAHVLRQGTPFQKAQALHAIAQQFNVDMNLPLQGAHSNPEIADVRQELAKTRSELQALVQQRQQQEDLGLRSQIESFSTQPGHEHFETVRTHMGALLESGVAKDMEEAYQQAIWAHPDLRSTLVEAQLKATEEKRIAEQKALSERARNAAVSVSGAPGSSRPLNGAVNPNSSIEDDIRAAYAEVRGRV